MARFQKTERRPDEAPRQMFTQADAEFLAGLQHELNTQDTMGNRDPRFWVIRQSRRVPCGKDEADGVAIIQASACETVATDMDGFVRHLADRYEKWGFKAEPKAAGTWSVSVASMAGEEFSDDWVSSPEDMIGLLESAGIQDYEAAYSRTEAENVPNTLFLTHSACEDHLRKYHYNYEPDAHAYAMTAVRSPEFERLVTILQTVRWDQVPVFREDGLGGAGWTGREAVIEKADLVPSEGQLDFRLVLKGKGWACEYDTGFPCGARAADPAGTRAAAAVRAVLSAAGADSLSGLAGKPVRAAFGNADGTVLGVGNADGTAWFPLGGPLGACFPPRDVL